jgi:thiosulfate/3-mercaptopyruvate sulfurtransferase
MRITLLLLAALCATPLAAEAASYPQPELLIEADQLQRLMADKDQPLSLIDVRSVEAVRSGTIAGAHEVDINQWKAAFGQGANAEAWSQRLSRIVAPRSIVVVFDDGVSPNAARAWWILKYWGVKDVRILNGGIKAWQEAGGELRPLGKFDAQYAFQAVPHPERLATAREVRDCLAEGDGAAAVDVAACLIDTRTTGEVAGGFIPTARHSDWADYVDPHTGKMRSAAELRALLAQAGFEADRPAVAYCQSGGRASVVAFAMELMGGQRVANYFGSWGEWRQLPGAPIAKPSP